MQDLMYIVCILTQWFLKPKGRFLGLLFLLILNMPIMAENESYAKVQGINVRSHLNVHASASIQSSVIAKLKNGDVVQLCDGAKAHNNFAKIKCGNTFGYVHISYISILDESPVRAQKQSGQSSNVSRFSWNKLWLILYFIVILAYISNKDDFGQAARDSLLGVVIAVIGLIIFRLFMITSDLLNWFTSLPFMSVFDIWGNLFSSGNTGSFISAVYVFVSGTGLLYCAAIFAGVSAIHNMSEVISNKTMILFIYILFGLVIIGAYDREYTPLMPYPLEPLCNFLHQSWCDFSFSISIDKAAHCLAFDLSAFVIVIGAAIHDMLEHS